MSDYNYATFDGYVASGAEQREFAAWGDVLHAGEPAPEIAGTSLDDGHQLALSSVWKRRTVVVEFGSFTWPYCAVEGPLLDVAADRHPDVAWYFVYTREAHPGEHVSHHTSFDDKLANARLLRDEVGIRRPILVDDLEGSTHHAYGLLPNMTWVVGRGGRILYRADWTSAANVEAFLQRHQEARSRRPPSGAISPYLSEQLEYRDVDREAFYDRLRRNGPRSYEEFKHAERMWTERG